MNLSLSSSTLEHALREGTAILSQSTTAQLDARVLMKHALGLDDAGLIGEARTVLASDARADFEALIARRQKGEPIAYITGVQEFWSLEFKVTPDVLIPRGDSECLIEAILERRPKEMPWSILDLGVGSGCLLSALLHEMHQSVGLGVDHSISALAVAKSNASSLGLSRRSAFMLSNWTADIQGRFDIIIANPPYIPEGQRSSLSVDVAGFEPGQALFAGIDGLDDYRAIMTDVARVLSPDGFLIFEIGDGDQAQQLSGMMERVFPGGEAQMVNDLENRPRGVLIDRKTFVNRD